MRVFLVWLWQEDFWYIAQAVDVDVASQGGSKDEALLNIKEALALHFAEPVASARPASSCAPVFANLVEMEMEMDLVDQ